MDKKENYLIKIVLTGLMTALVFLATSIIKIPFANGGYIHFGDGFIFLSVYILGPFYGAFASGIGSMLSDLLSPYAQWAVPSLIIKSVMAVIMGLITGQRTKKSTWISAGTTLTLWIGFVFVLKYMVSTTLRQSTVSLAKVLDTDAISVVQLSSELQWKLTFAVVAFIVLVFVFLLRLGKSRRPPVLRPRLFLGMISAGSWMIAGYYFTEYFLYGNAISPIFSLPMNLLQLSLGIVITVLLTPALAKITPLINGKANGK